MGDRSEVAFVDVALIAAWAEQDHGDGRGGVLGDGLVRDLDRGDEQPHRRAQSFERPDDALVWDPVVQRLSELRLRLLEQSLDLVGHHRTGVVVTWKKEHTGH